MNAGELIAIVYGVWLLLVWIVMGHGTSKRHR